MARTQSRNLFPRRPRGTQPDLRSGLRRPPARRLPRRLVTARSVIHGRAYANRLLKPCPYPSELPALGTRATDAGDPTRGALGATQFSEVCRGPNAIPRAKSPVLA